MSKSCLESQFGFTLVPVNMDDYFDLDDLNTFLDQILKDEFIINFNNVQIEEERSLQNVYGQSNYEFEVLNENNNFVVSNLFKPTTTLQTSRTTFFDESPKQLDNKQMIYFGEHVQNQINPKLNNQEISNDSNRNFHLNQNDNFTQYTIIALYCPVQQCFCVCLNKNELDNHLKVIHGMHQCRCLMPNCNKSFYSQ